MDSAQEDRWGPQAHVLYLFSAHASSSPERHPPWASEEGVSPVPGASGFRQAGPPSASPLTRHLLVTRARGMQPSSPFCPLGGYESSPPPSSSLLLPYVCVSSSCSRFSSLSPSPAAGATASPSPSSLDGGYLPCPAHSPLPVHPLGPTQLGGLCACLWRSAYLCPPGPAPATGRRRQLGGGGGVDRAAQTTEASQAGSCRLSPAVCWGSPPPPSATCQGPRRGGGIPQVGGHQPSLHQTPLSELHWPLSQKNSRAGRGDLPSKQSLCQPGRERPNVSFDPNAPSPDQTS